MSQLNKTKTTVIKILKVTFTALKRFAIWVKAKWVAYRAWAKKRQQEKEAEQQRLKAEELAKETARREARHADLIETLSDDFNALEHNLGGTYKFMTPEQISSYIFQLGSEISGHNLNIMNNKKEVMQVFKSGFPITINRTVVDMNEKEIGILRLMSFMNSLNLISDKYYDYVQLCIAYNSGKSTMQYSVSHKVTKCSDTAVMVFSQAWTKSTLEPPQIAINESIAQIGRIRKDIDDPELKATIEKELLGARGWMKAEAI